MARHVLRSNGDTFIAVDITRFSTGQFQFDVYRSGLVGAMAKDSVITNLTEPEVIKLTNALLQSLGLDDRVEEFEITQTIVVDKGLRITK